MMQMKFSLRSAFVVVALIAATCAWMRRKERIEEMEARATQIRVVEAVKVSREYRFRNIMMKRNRNEQKKSALARHPWLIDFEDRPIKAFFDNGDVYALCFLAEAGDHDFVNIGRLPALRIIAVHQSPISTVAIEALSKCRSVEELYLDGCTEIDDEALACVERMPRLRALYLWGTSVTDSGLKHLCALQRLQALSLSETRISDAGLSHLVTLQNLRYLDLYRTRCTEAGIERLRSNLPNLYVTRSFLD